MILCCPPSSATWQVAKTDHLTPKYNFYYVYPRFHPFLSHLSCILSANILFYTTSHGKISQPCYFWGHQNSWTVLLLGTSKFVDRIIFGPKIFWGLPNFSSWLKPCCSQHIYSTKYMVLPIV